MLLLLNSIRHLPKQLNRLQTEDGRLHVIQADFLSLQSMNCSMLIDGKSFPICPITSRHRSSRHSFPHYPTIESITIMVQKEVADRMVAAAHTPNYSSLSLFVNFYAEAKLCFKVEPTCFYPRPKIQSAVVNCHFILLLRFLLLNNFFS